MIETLHYFPKAAAGGDVEILQELILKFGRVHIPHNTLINMYNLLGYTMLHYAVMYKRMNCIKVLIEFGAGLLFTCMHSINKALVLIYV